MRCVAWLLILLSGCSSSHALVVDLRTDLQTGDELSSVAIVLETADGVRLGSTMTPADPSGDYLSGVRVASFEGIEHDQVRLRVDVLGASGASVAGTRLAVQLRATQTAVTVVITRDCRGVECPPSGGAASEAACLAGMCVDESCSPETPDLCPAPECTSDAECPTRSCAVGRCLDGTCFSDPDPVLCDADERCDPDGGCTPIIDCDAADLGVVAHYEFETATDGTDIVGGHDGAVGGVTSSVSGICGSAMRFGDSASGYVVIDDDPAFRLAEGALDFWMRVDTLPSAPVGVIAKDANGFAAGHVAVLLSEDGVLVARLQTDADEVYRCTVDPIEVGRWAHVALTFGGPPGVRLYVDDVEASSTASFPLDFSPVGTVTANCGTSSEVGLAVNGEPWIIGATNGGVESSIPNELIGFFAGGIIDRVRVFSERPDGAPGGCTELPPTEWIPITTPPVGVAVAALPAMGQWAAAIDVSETSVQFATASLEGTIHPITVVGGFGAWGLAIQPVPPPDLAVVAVQRAMISRVARVTIGAAGAVDVGPDAVGSLTGNGTGTLVSGEPVFVIDEQGVGVPMALYRFPSAGAPALMQQLAYTSPPVPVPTLAARADGSFLMAVGRPDGAADHCDLLPLTSVGEPGAAVSIASSGECLHAAAAELTDGSVVFVYSDTSAVAYQRFAADLTPVRAAIALGAGGAGVVEVWPGAAGSFHAVWDDGTEVRVVNIASDETASRRSFSSPAPGLARSARQGETIAVGFPSATAYMLTIVCD